MCVLCGNAFDLWRWSHQINLKYTMMYICILVPYIVTFRTSAIHSVREFNRSLAVCCVLLLLLLRLLPLWVDAACCRFWYCHIYEIRRASSVHNVALFCGCVKNEYFLEISSFRIYYYWLKSVNGETLVVCMINTLEPPYTMLFHGFHTKPKTKPKTEPIQSDHDLSTYKLNFCRSVQTLHFSLTVRSTQRECHCFYLFYFFALLESVRLSVKRAQPTPMYREDIDLINETY